MRQESTGKSDPERARASEAAEPAQKRGFFAAAGARLKRVIGRPEPAPAEAPASVAAGPENVDSAAEAEVSTSVQARARELLLQDRGRGRTRAAGEADLDASRETGSSRETDGQERARRSSPPPLPSQRMAARAHASAAADADAVNTGVTAIPPQRAARIAAKRPPRDSKSEALRARLGAAKAALAEAQAKRTESENAARPEASGATPLAADSSAQPEAASERDGQQVAADGGPEHEAERIPQQPAAAETRAADPGAQHEAERIPQQPAAADSTSPLEAAEREITLEQADLEDAEDDPEIELLYELEDEAEDLRAIAADAEAAPAAISGEPSARAETGTEPIRTLTIARLLARQGYFDRSLSIYDELLAASASDLELQAEAQKVRASAQQLRAEPEKPRAKKRSRKRAD